MEFFSLKNVLEHLICNQFTLKLTDTELAWVKLTYAFIANRNSNSQENPFSSMF